MTCTGSTKAAMATSGCFLTLLWLFRDPFKVLEKVERGGLFTNYFLRYESKWLWQKQINSGLSSPKRMNMSAGQKIFNHVPIQLTEYSRKQVFNLNVDNKLQKNMEHLHCPTCKNKKCFNMSTNKTSSFHDCKKCKTSCYMPNVPSKKQSPILTLFVGDGTYCVAKKKLICDYTKQCLFLKNFLRQPQSTATELEAKKDKSTPHIA